MNQKLFLTEETMVKEFDQFKFEDNMLRFYEFGVGYGVADVVYCMVNKNIVQERLLNGPHYVIEDKNSIRIVDYLSKNGESTLNLMMEELYLTKNNLKYILLKRLINNGFVEEYQREKYRLTFNYQPLVDHIIAIEAKLKDWWSGYVQARRYLHFAHQSYLAIDTDYKHRVKRQILERDKLGLLSVNEDRVIPEFHAIISKPKDKYLYLLANEKAFSLILNQDKSLHNDACRDLACI